MALQKPIKWCDESKGPISFIGDQRLQDYEVSVYTLLEQNNSESSLGARNMQGGCQDAYKYGYNLVISSLTGNVSLYSGYKLLFTTHKFNIKILTWYQLKLKVNGYSISAYVNHITVVEDLINSDFNMGFATIGSSFHHVLYYDFKFNAKPVVCVKNSGTPVVSRCSFDNSQRWNIVGKTIRNLDKCLTWVGGSGTILQVGDCQEGNLLQQFDTRTESFFTNISPASNHSKCLDIANQDPNNCATVQVWDCNKGANQYWFLYAKGIANIPDGSTVKCLENTK